MSRTNPLDTLNAMVIYQTKGLPYRNKLRMAILSRLSGNDIKSSLEIPISTVTELLEIYFPAWQDPDSYPSKDDQQIIHDIAEQCLVHIIEEFGPPEEYYARLEAENNARHAAKEAAKAERIRLHNEREKKKREANKKEQPATLAVLPTVRQRRVFES